MVDITLLMTGLVYTFIIILSPKRLFFSEKCPDFETFTCCQVTSVKQVGLMGILCRAQPVSHVQCILINPLLR